MNRAAIALPREPAEFEAAPPNLGADEAGDVIAPLAPVEAGTAEHPPAGGFGFELVLEQMKHCLHAAGSSMTQVVKCNVYCTPDPTHFAKFNEVYERYFPTQSPARIFLHVPSWPGPFDVEIDCVAVVEAE